MGKAAHLGVADWTDAVRRGAMSGGELQYSQRRDATLLVLTESVNHSGVCS